MVAHPVEQFFLVVAANALLATLTGVILKYGNQFALLGWIVPIAGIIICSAWFLITIREYSYYEYWFACARHFERQIQDPLMRIFQRGRTFAEGATVCFVCEKIRMSCLARLFKINWLMNTVIFAFAAIHIFLLLKAWKLVS